MNVELQARRRKWMAASGALLAALAVMLSAYAAHGAEGVEQARLQQSALFAFGHGIALASLAPLAVRWLGLLALSFLLLGTLLFSGSLAAAHFFATTTLLAPFGGGLMIVGWLLHAFMQIRR